MTQPTYVIKSYEFGYNDEYFYPCGSSIYHSFSNREEAEKIYRYLEVRAARSIEYLPLIESLSEGSEDLSQSLSAFVSQKIGEPFVIFGDNKILPSSLSDDDVFQFIQMADIHYYQLLTFEGEAKFYGLWLPQENSYYIEEDVCYLNLVYYCSPDELLQELDYLIKYQWKNFQVEGELTEISETPFLLEQLINNNPDLSYDPTQKILTVRGEQRTTYIELNALLKQPFYEIKELTVDQVKEIEKSLAEKLEAMYEDEDYE